MDGGTHLTHLTKTGLTSFLCFTSLRGRSFADGADRRRCQRLFLVVVDQTADAVKPRLMAEMANGDPLLAGLGELRPVLGEGIVVITQPPKVGVGGGVRGLVTHMQVRRSTSCHPAAHSSQQVSPCLVLYQSCQVASRIFPTDARPPAGLRERAFHSAELLFAQR
jgi:hypothetical protein